MSGAGAALFLNLAITLSFVVGPPALTGVESALGDSAPYLVMAVISLAALAGLARLSERVEPPSACEAIQGEPAR